MKCIIQVPCYNEETTLPAVLRDLPKSIEGVDCLQIQIIDDGSVDNTVGVAREHGVDHIVSLTHNRGLAEAFKAGVLNAIKENADILVNTDGDNQYAGEDVATLVRCMIEKQADLVIGCRPIMDHHEFPWYKKCLQVLGSWVVRFISKTTVPDATSGFRAYSKNAMLRLNIVSRFSYCLETIVQAGLSNMKVRHVPIRVNDQTRESRLFRSIPEYIYKQGKTVLSMVMLYRPGLFFGLIGSFFLALSGFLTARFLYIIYIRPDVASNFWPTLIAAGIFFVIAGIIFSAGFIAAILHSQRTISEETLYFLRKSFQDECGRKMTDMPDGRTD